MIDVCALSSYGYGLPEHLIAQQPTQRREMARLMVINRAQGTIVHDTFKNIGAYLPLNSLIVVNNSKVIPARLIGKKQRSGGEVEVFLLKAMPDGHCFEALLRPLKKIHQGDEMVFEGGLSAVLEDKEKRIVRFAQKNILSLLSKLGHMPLPPYIKREDTLEDKKDYQTVYAKHPGSVAAPTAGLHFTKALMARLKDEGHAFKELTLHINYGTFKPVESQDIRQHPMHTESFQISQAVYDDCRQARQHKRPIVAVGTTACRTLESAALKGAGEHETNLFIYPGFEFKMVDCLVTNFHLPHSTLLMLVCAFGGYDLIMKAYSQAIKAQYRFYSYGDAMLVL